MSKKYGTPLSLIKFAFYKKQKKNLSHVQSHWYLLRFLQSKALFEGVVTTVFA